MTIYHRRYGEMVRGEPSARGKFLQKVMESGAAGLLRPFAENAYPNYRTDVALKAFLRDVERADRAKPSPLFDDPNAPEPIL